MDLSAIYELVEKTKSDSKKESTSAEQELIGTCEPLIHKYYKAIGEFLDESVHMAFGHFMSRWFNDYSLGDGINEFLNLDKERNVLRLYCSYNNGIVEMPVCWLDAEKFEMNMNDIKEKVLNEYIEMQKRQIDEYRHYIEIHKEEVKKSKAKLEELQKLI